MGWQQNIFPLLIINATGGFTGLFVYSPLPGPGNLIASVAAAPGTDPYGNTYPAGIASLSGNLSGQTITGSTFQGFNFVIDNQGIRLYEAPSIVQPPPPPPPPPPVPYVVGGSSAAGTAAAQVVPVAVATAAGDLIHVSANAASGGAAVTGVADSKGNTYLSQAADATQIPTSVWTAAGATAALTTLDTITVTYASTTGQKLVSVCGVRGLPAAPVDQHVIAAGLSTNPQATSLALAEATEVAIATLGSANAGGTPNWASGWLTLDQRQFGSSQYLSTVYQDVSSAAPLVAGATILSGKWALGLVTLKEV